MGDTLSPKITDKVLYIQHLNRSRYDSTDFFRLNVRARVKQQCPGVYLWKNIFVFRRLHVFAESIILPVH